MESVEVSINFAVMAFTSIAPTADKLRQAIRVDVSSDDHRQELSSDLGSFFMKSVLTDVVIYADGQPIHAHKALLAARSPVFQAIFERSLYDRRPNVILINDMSYEVVKEMIGFLYTGKITLVSLELLQASEKYGIKGLKKICEATLIKRLSVSNAVDTLVTAFVHKSTALETASIKYVALNWKHIKRDKSFSTLYSWPIILTKIIDFMAKV